VGSAAIASSTSIRSTADAGIPWLANQAACGGLRETWQVLARPPSDKRYGRLLGAFGLVIGSLLRIVGRLSSTVVITAMQRQITPAG
jgi:hypothetical protein